jgi:hypothetical protein
MLPSIIFDPNKICMKTLYKKILNFQFIAILGISMLFSLNGKSAEFVIINDTISYPNATDNNFISFTGTHLCL